MKWKLVGSIYGRSSVTITHFVPNSHWVDMSLHSDTLFWFQASQSLLFLLNAAFLVEKQQIPILYSFVWQDRSSYPYKTVCAELAFTKSPSTEWAWFCIELIIRFLYLLCSWIIAIFQECLNKSRNSQCLYRYQVAAFLAEKQQIPILYSFVWQDRSSYPKSIALEASTLTITLPMRFPIFILF
jgi:hypothetical protein